ncbi:MAG: GDP-mannose pyrophosphatase, partial [Verrucomicrobia bacterium]|nr:GDP-mannose pyrophosphatase [Verrucomicrobiota bacterium]
TEKLHFFVAEYDSHEEGTIGGSWHEGEEIEVLELPFGEALAMIADGKIQDAKTILLLQHAAITGLLD